MKKQRLLGRLGLISLFNPLWCHFQDTLGKEQIQEDGDRQEKSKFY